MVKVEEGAPAPFTGILVDAEQMEKFRALNERAKLLEEQTVQLEDLALVKDRKIELYQDEADMFRTKYRRQQFKTFWSNAGYFALGVLVTGLAAKAAIESTR